MHTWLKLFWLLLGYNWLFYFLRPYMLLLKIIFGVFLLQDFCCDWLNQKDLCLYNEVWSRDRTQFERRSSTNRGQLRNTPPHHKQLVLYISRGVQTTKNINIAIFRSHCLGKSRLIVVTISLNYCKKEEQYCY